MSSNHKSLKTKFSSLVAGHGEGGVLVHEPVLVQPVDARDEALADVGLLGAAALGDAGHHHVGVRAEVD